MVDEGCQVGQKFLFRPSWKSHLFPAWIYSGMLYRLDISTFYFHQPLLFQIFFPWKLKKLLSLLQPTAKQITISINKFICFKYYIVWNQFCYWKPWSTEKILYRKKNYFFFCRLCKNYWITRYTHMTDVYACSNVAKLFEKKLYF